MRGKYEAKLLSLGWREGGSVPPCVAVPPGTGVCPVVQQVALLDRSCYIRSFPHFVKVPVVGLQTKPHGQLNPIKALWFEFLICLFSKMSGQLK